MRKNKTVYSSPLVELLTLNGGDVITTSGFNGKEDVLGAQKPLSLYELDINVLRTPSSSLHQET